MTHAGGPARTATARRFLMCPPAYFNVSYRINPWMDPAKPTDASLAVAQWDRLRQIYLRLGHRVELIRPAPGLPDMVFTANAATVLGGQALIARFRHAERTPEGPVFESWFRDRNYLIHQPRYVNEGQGDFLLAGSRILAGTGFRTEPRAHAEASHLFGLPVVSLTLTDPRFYHLDTALAVLDREVIMYYPPAFSAESQAVLCGLYPQAIIANDADAEVFGLNAVSDGLHVLLPEQAVHLTRQLRARGFLPIGVGMSELTKAGGSAKCCTLELAAD